MYTDRDEKYRGLGKDVSKCKTLKEALKVASLDWKVLELDAEAVIPLQEKNVHIRDWKVIARPDPTDESGYRVFDVPTRGYIAAQNEEILQVFFDVAKVGDMKLETLGSIDHGRRIFGVARLDGEFHFPGVSDKDRIDHGQGNEEKDDRTYLKVLMGAAHYKGLANSIDVIAERQICTNGLRISEGVGRWKFVHRRRFVESDRVEIVTFVGKAKEAFENYKHTATLLHDTKFPEKVSEMYMVELQQPELLKQAVEHVKGKAKKLDPDSTEFGARLIDYVVSKGDQILDRKKFNTPVGNLLASIAQQPGYEMAPETGWITYNAVTWFVDHRKGRNNDTGVESAFYGSGAKIKIDALNLAKNYCERLALT